MFVSSGVEREQCNAYKVWEATNLAEGCHGNIYVDREDVLWAS